MNSIAVILKRQSGVVSIFVTMIMMIVISLIVLGFAEVSRTEQRNSLDDQLSVQAYYAAESGINDARAAINNFLSIPATVPSKTTCSNNDANYTLSGIVDSTYNVSYTCVLINAAPTALYYNNIGPTSKVIPIISTTPFGSLTLNWTAASGSSAPCNSILGAFPPATTAAWNCNLPVLRVDLTDGTSLARSTWPQNTSTIFFEPARSGTGNASWPAQGSIVGVTCRPNGNPTDCRATITGLTKSKYYMRVTAIYKTSPTLTITAGGGNMFENAQATIDSTGKAQAILRRILVAVDLTDANTYAI